MTRLVSAVDRRYRMLRYNVGQAVVAVLATDGLYYSHAFYGVDYYDADYYR